jgi:uncharacterized protein
MHLGIISDTHGLLRPEAIDALQSVDHILHIGDVGKPEVLTQLRELAPLTAIRGNVDRGPWAEALPTTEVFEAAGTFIYLLHDLHDLDLDPVAAGFQVVLSGHSHRPAIQTREGVLYLNPGSAGPFRFKLPVTLAYLYLGDGPPHAELVELVQR